MFLNEKEEERKEKIRKGIQYVSVLATVCVAAFLLWQSYLSQNIVLLSTDSWTEKFCDKYENGKCFHNCSFMEDITWNKSTNGFCYSESAVFCRRLPSIEKDELMNKSFRIVVLGDSISRGKEPYSMKLERKFKEYCGKGMNNVEVINLAIGGYSLKEKVRSFEKVGKELHPDLIILQYLKADMLETPEARYEYLQDVKDYCEKHEYMSSQKYREILRPVIFNESRNETRLERKRMEYFKELERLSNGTDMIFLMAFPPHEFWKYRPIDISAKNQAEELGWHVLDMKNTFDEYDKRKIWLSQYDFHLSKFSHKLIARELYELISRKYKGKETCD